MTVKEQKSALLFFLEELERQNVAPALTSKLLSVFRMDGLASRFILETQLDVAVVCGRRFAVSCYSLETRSFISPFIYDILLKWKSAKISVREKELLAQRQTERMGRFESVCIPSQKKLIESNPTAYRGYLCKEDSVSLDREYEQVSQIENPMNKSRARARWRLHVAQCATAGFQKQSQRWIGSQTELSKSFLTTHALPFANAAFKYVQTYLFSNGPLGTEEEKTYRTRYREHIPMWKSLRIFNPEFVIADVNEIDDFQDRMEHVRRLVVDGLKNLINCNPRTFPPSSWHDIESGGEFSALWEAYGSFRALEKGATTRERADHLYRWWMQLSKREDLCLWRKYARQALLALGSQTDAERMLSVLKHSRNKLQNRATDERVELAAMLRYNHGVKGGLETKEKRK